MTTRTVTTAPGALSATVDPGAVWRVGYAPDPWSWTPWQYAGEAGCFSGRWDDPRGAFRTVYAGSQLLGCLLEVLAPFRPDPLLEEELASVEDDLEYRSRRPGTVPVDWLSRRQATWAVLTGVYCAVTDKGSLAALRASFLPSALRYGLADLDAGVLRLSAPRELTQVIAAWLYDLHEGSAQIFDGVQFESRHGDGLVLWAVFEREKDPDVSTCITDVHLVTLDRDHPDLVEAFRLHQLAWAD